MRRTLSTPTGVGTIVLASALLFGVVWVDPVAIAALVFLFALVSAGAAMLVASMVANEHHVAAVGPAIGMLFGLLGGTMVPIEVFPAAMKAVSHMAPQAWAMEAFRTLNAGGAGLASILPEMAVLAGFAAVLTALASVRLRRSIASGGV